MDKLDHSRVVHQYNMQNDKLRNIQVRKVCQIPFKWAPSPTASIVLYTIWPMDEPCHYKVVHLKPPQNWQNIISGRCCQITSPANKNRWINVVLLLGRRRRRRANIKTTLAQRLVCAGLYMPTPPYSLSHPPPRTSHSRQYRYTNEELNIS